MERRLNFYVVILVQQILTFSLMSYVIARAPQIAGSFIELKRCSNESAFPLILQEPTFEVADQVGAVEVVFWLPSVVISERCYSPLSICVFLSYDPKPFQRMRQCFTLTPSSFSSIRSSSTCSTQRHVSSARHSLESTSYSSSLPDIFFFFFY